MVTLQTSFKLHLLTGRGVIYVVEVTVNSKEENSLGFCPNYVQQFGLRMPGQNTNSGDLPADVGKVTTFDL
jgi:hypothetical protein